MASDFIRSWRSAPQNPPAAPRPSVQALQSGDVKVEWLMDPHEISICKKEDGTDHLLGRGAFGKVPDVMPSQMQYCTVPRVCLRWAGGCKGQWKGMRWAPFAGAKLAYRPWPSMHVHPEPDRDTARGLGRLGRKLQREHGRAARAGIFSKWPASGPFFKACRGTETVFTH